MINITKADDYIEIGYLSLCESLPLFVAKEMKFFDRVGLNVTMKEFTSGNAILSAICNGKLAGGSIESIPFLFAKDKNIPIEAVCDGGEITQARKSYCALITNKRSGIKKISDLKNRTVAINGYNTNADILLKIAGIKEGISDFIKIKTMPMWAMKESLNKNSIHAAFVFEPYIGKNNKEKLFDLEQLMDSFQNSYFCFSKYYLETQTEIVYKFKRAYTDAINYISNNLTASRKHLVKWTNIDSEYANSVTLPEWNPDLNFKNSIKLIKEKLQAYKIKERGRVKVRNVNVTFKGEKTVQAIKDLNFTVEPGEFVCILGTTGCGKSTIINAIAGFVQQTSGKISLDDKIIKQPGEERGVVFQTHALFPWKTVKSNIEFGLKMKGINPKDRNKIVQNYLDLVGLSNFGKSYPIQLSGGMAQRVGIARVLANDPLVILMDEPFGSLDAQTRQMMQELLLKIWQDTLKTVIFITHDIDEAIYLADRILILTASPGTIKKEVMVTLPRPRTYDIITSNDFNIIKSDILSEIREESLKNWKPPVKSVTGSDSRG